MSETLQLQGYPAWIRPWIVYSLDYFQLYSGGQVDSKGRITGGYRPVITSGVRSMAKQQQLYDARATNPYPVNRPGDSAHQYGLGFDSSFSADLKPYLMPHWVAVRRAIGWRVPDNDAVHAEVPDWRTYV